MIHTVKTENFRSVVNLWFSEIFFRTQFFVWCDDDFQFGNETDLSYMVHVAETTGFDIIGGALNEHERSAWAKPDFYRLRRSETGFCFNRFNYKNLALPGTSHGIFFRHKWFRVRG